MPSQIRQYILADLIRPANKIAVKIVEAPKIEDTIADLLKWANKEKHKIINIVGAYSRKYKIAAIYSPQEPDSGPDLQCAITAKDGDFDRALRQHSEWLARNTDKIIVKDITFSSYDYTTIVFFTEDRDVL